MSIANSLSCPQCGMIYSNIASVHVGRRMSCRQCHAVFSIAFPADANQPAPQLDLRQSGNHNCPSCNTLYRDVPADFDGRVMRCRNCGDRFKIKLASIRTEDVKPAGQTASFAGTTSASVFAVAKQDDSVITDWQPQQVILGLYRVIGVLGEGAMGKVYRVYHQGWNMDLAVKSPRQEILTAPGASENIFKEAETWVNLGLHPNIVSCYYVRSLSGIPHLFAEYVDGGGLDEWILKATDGRPKLYRFGAEQALQKIIDIAIQFAWGLEYAHCQGMIHQDIKPANVMLTRSGIVKVTDFGLARMIAGNAGDTGQDAVNAAGLVKTAGFTPRYCSPEQAEQKLLSSKTDVWSWALSILVMFTGKIVWRHGESAMEALDYYVKYPPKEDDIPAMPQIIGDLLRQCFQKDPEARPTMTEVAHVLLSACNTFFGCEFPREVPKMGGIVAGSLNNRAVSLLDLGQFEKAEALWHNALKSDPGHTESVFNLGLIQWRQVNEPDDMVVVNKLDECRKSHTYNWLDNYLLGQLHLERGDCNNVLVELKKISPEESVQFEEIGGLQTYAQQHYDESRRFLGDLGGHQGKVLAVAIKTGEFFAASGGEDGLVKLWDLSAGCCLATLHGHTASVTTVCWHPHQQLVVSASEDNTLRLWDMRAGSCIRVFKGHDKPVSSVCFSRKGEWIVSGGCDNFINIWDANSGHCVRTLQGHIAYVNSVFASADGLFLVSGSGSSFAKDYGVKLWSLMTGRCQHTFLGHASAVQCVCMSADGQRILSGSEDGMLKLWNVADGNCVGTWRGSDAGINAVGFNGNGESAFSVAGSVYADDNSIRIWDSQNGRCLCTLRASSPIYAAVLASDNKYMLTGHGNGQLQWWSVAAGTYHYHAPMALSRVLASETLVSTASIYESAMTNARLSKRLGNAVKAASFVRKARLQPGQSRAVEAMKLWSELYLKLPRIGFNGGWEVNSFKDHKGCVRAADFNKDANLVLSAGEDTLRLWSSVTAECLQVFSGHTGGINAVALSDDARLALSGGDDQTVKLWNTTTGLCQQSLLGHVHQVRAVSLFTDGRYALSASSDESIKLWDLRSGSCIRTYRAHHGPVLGLCIGPDGNWFLSSGEDGVINLWHVQSKRCKRSYTGHQGQVLSVDVALDNQLFLSGGADGMLKLWHIESGICLRTLQAHDHFVLSVSLSGNGMFALSSSHDGSVKLWDLTKGECLRTFQGHSGAVRCTRFCSDQRFGLSAGDDRMVKLWSLDWELGTTSDVVQTSAVLPYLHIFLQQRALQAAAINRKYYPALKIVLYNLLCGKRQIWNETDLAHLQHTLGCVGYGSLTKEKLKLLLAEMEGGHCYGVIGKFTPLIYYFLLRL